MRRPARGHHVVFQRLALSNDGLHVSRTAVAYCERCGSAWSWPVSSGTARKILVGDRGTLAQVIKTATASGPSCEEAQCVLLAFEVMES